MQDKKEESQLSLQEILTRLKEQINEQIFTDSMVAISLIEIFQIEMKTIEELKSLTINFAGGLIKQLEQFLLKNNLKSLKLDIRKTFAGQKSI